VRSLSSLGRLVACLRIEDEERDAVRPRPRVRKAAPLRTFVRTMPSSKRDSRSVPKTAAWRPSPSHQVRTLVGNAMTEPSARWMTSFGAAEAEPTTTPSATSVRARIRTPLIMGPRATHIHRSAAGSNLSPERRGEEHALHQKPRSTVWAIAAHRGVTPLSDTASNPRMRLRPAAYAGGPSGIAPSCCIIFSASKTPQCSWARPSSPKRMMSIS
jgi:hypothetical protein